MPLEVFPPHHRLEVGDKLAIALRPKDTVRHPTQVLATLHRPDGSVLQATTRLDPRRAVEVFQGCDPVRGIPDSCKDGPRRTIMTGGGDVTVIFRGDPLILPEPGTYRIDFCGVDGRIDAEPVTFRIGRDPFAYLFPRGNVAGFRPIERQIFRSDPAHPRYQITYVLDEKTSPDARPTIDVIIAPFPDAATARREMNRIAAWGHPIRTFQSGIEVFENDGTYRIRWVTHAAFVHLETHNLSLPEARRFTDHLLTHHPIATR